MKITVLNKENEVLAVTEGNDLLELAYNEVYQVGDKFVFEGKAGEFFTITVDPNVVESVVYMTKDQLEFTLPQGDWKRSYHPESFAGKSHVLTMKKTEEAVINQRRNLALNGLDKRGDQNYYPHTDPNIVTREEPWFEGRNTVDGYKDTKGHGPFPYQSWGGGLRDDLEFRLYFGREVMIDEVILYLRADYKNDHDINWHSGIIEFSDGSKLPIEMLKTTEGQSYKFEPKKVTWIKLNHLRREVSEAFSALIQIEVFGREI